MKIGVIGAGRLGICFALLAEAAGYDVLVSDIREDYVEKLNQRKIETNEPEVANLLERSKNFRATTDNKEVIDECDLIWVLVATPSLENGDYDVSSVWNVVLDFQEVKKTKHLIIGCTTNPGDCSSFQQQLPHNVHVYYNPEFIAQGSIIKDLREADMVLLGLDLNAHGSSSVWDVERKINKLYHDIQTTRVIFSVMSTGAAEITKIALNCFLTTKISYANMVGDVLRQAGCGDEITAVLNSIGADSRVGRKYLRYGYGYGGPCLPRDNRAFASFAKRVGLDYNLGTTTDEINNKHSDFLGEYYSKMNKDGHPFYFEYITYKKGTDIMVESQQFRLCLDLLTRGYMVYIKKDRRVPDEVYEDILMAHGENVRFVDDKKYIIGPVFIVDL
jgi:nucleotide sugar dehydrogenase